MWSHSGCGGCCCLDILSRPVWEDDVFPKFPNYRLENAWRTRDILRCFVMWSTLFQRLGWKLVGCFFRIVVATRTTRMTFLGEFGGLRLYHLPLGQLGPQVLNRSIIIQNPSYLRVSCYPFQRTSHWANGWREKTTVMRFVGSENVECHGS